MLSYFYHFNAWEFSFLTWEFSFMIFIFFCRLGVFLFCSLGSFPKLVIFCAPVFSNSIFGWISSGFCNIFEDIFDRGWWLRKEFLASDSSRYWLTKLSMLSSELSEVLSLKILKMFLVFKKIQFYTWVFYKVTFV